MSVASVKKGVLNTNMDVDISRIQEYDFKNIPEHATVLLIAKRRSGKTFMMRHIMHDIGDRFDHVYLMSVTSMYNLDDPYPFIHESNYRNYYDEGLIERCINEQKGILLREKQKEPKYRHVPKLCFILDDIIAEDSIRSSNVLKELFILGRHLHITLFVLMQTASKLNGLPRICFTNCDLAISFNCTEFFSLDTLSRDFASLLGHKVGQNLIRGITSEKPYQAIVFDNQAQNVVDYSQYCFKKIAKEFKSKDFKLLGRPDLHNYSIGMNFSANDLGNPVGTVKGMPKNKKDNKIGGKRRKGTKKVQIVP